MTVAAPSVLVCGSVLGQPMGGVRRHNMELLPRAARLLAARGGRLAVLEGRDPIPFDLGPTIERISSRVPSRPALVRALEEGRALERVLAAARSAGRPFQLVHTAHLPAPRSLSAPFTLTLHDLRSVSLSHSPFSRRFFGSHVIASAVRAAACTLTVSESVRRVVGDCFRPRALALVPNAADHLKTLPRQPNADAPLLAVGHLEPRKNLELLLRSLALDKGLPDLWLAGAAKHQEDQRLEGLARAWGLLGRVRFLGPVDDDRLSELYARAACVVIPSRLEGFGIGALEAQLALVPLAISDTPALLEVAGPGVPRFGVDDPAGCARAVRQALARPSAELQAERQAASRFRWDASAELLVSAWAGAARVGAP